MEKTGFIRIAFPSSVGFERLHNAAKEFFYLSQNDKNQSAKDKVKNIYYGYFPANLDGKEGLDIPNVSLKPKCHVLANQINFSPNYDDNNIRLIYNYYKFMDKLSRELMNILTNDKEISYESEKNMSMLRFNYYPKHDIDDIPICDQDDVKLACESHVDSSLLTILYQDKVGGLQIQDPNTNKWINVEYMSNSLIINTGKLLGLMTNNKYVPGLHRVLFNLEERISIPYFMYPTYDAKINNITCGDYLISTLKMFKEYKYIEKLIE